MIVRAGDFLQKGVHVGDVKIKDAIGARANDAEIGVAQHDRVGGAPFVAGKQAGVGQDRDVVGGERMFARSEGIAELAEIHELRDL